MPADPSRRVPESARGDIAVIAALAIEREPLERQLPDNPSAAIRVYQCGPGHGRAYDAARSALASGASALISWGVAGGLASDLQPGDVVIPRRVVASNGASFGTDARWREQLHRELQSGFRANDADLFSAAGILESGAAKSAVAAATGAAAVDMESGAVARAATEAGRPFVAIRVVLDARDDALPGDAARWLDQDGNIRRSACLRALLTPVRWAELVRLSRRYRTVRGVLDDLATLLAPASFHYRGGQDTGG